MNDDMLKALINKPHPRSLRKGDYVRLLRGGGVIPLIGFKNGDIYEVEDPAYERSYDIRVRILKPSGFAGYARLEDVERVDSHG